MLLLTVPGSACAAEGHLELGWSPAGTSGTVRPEDVWEELRGDGRV
ncbi:hypothetical protein [Streptomyces africanus]|nr:hypothetical protein [Streptomyces africanus]